MFISNVCAEYMIILSLLLMMYLCAFFLRLSAFRQLSDIVLILPNSIGLHNLVIAVCVNNITEYSAFWIGCGFVVWMHFPQCRFSRARFFRGHAHCPVHCSVLLTSILW